LTLFILFLDYKTSELKTEEESEIMARKTIYCVCVDNEYRILPLESLIQLRKLQYRHSLIWSARLSTGLFGLTNCPAGNRGPKALNEILLAIGDSGLQKLVSLGFITCPVCRPERISGFWGILQDTIQKKYGLTELTQFVDKRILPFDARRVEWEEIIPILGGWPNRLYIPERLKEDELMKLKSRIENIGYGLPAVGYYNRSTPERFTPYNLV